MIETIATSKANVVIADGLTVRLATETGDAIRVRAGTTTATIVITATMVTMAMVTTATVITAGITMVPRLHSTRATRRASIPAPVMRSAGRTSIRRDRTTIETLRRRRSVRDSYVAMTRAIGNMPAMETVATEMAATAIRVVEREAFWGISLDDLKFATDRLISKLKCRASKARHFSVLNPKQFEVSIRDRSQDTGSLGPAAWVTLTWMLLSDESM